MNGHHLILGELEDFITGEVLTDTHDERYRQQLARLLVQEKGFLKTDIHPRRELVITAGDSKAVIVNDFLVRLQPLQGKACKACKACMIVKYGPGSVVSRHRPALAISRLIEPYQIPVVVVTNGRDADILDGNTGKKTAGGLNAIPSKTELLQKLEDKEFTFDPISPERAEKESRIAFAMEVDLCCPCADTVRRL